MKIVVLDGFTLNPGDLSWKEMMDFGDLTVYDRTLPEEIVERSKEAEVLLTNKTVIGADVIDRLPLLKYIGVLATGYNVVDLPAAKRRGIIVTNVPAYSTDSVAQMVFAHLLNITQRVGHYADEVREGKWCAQSDFSYWNTSLIELVGKKIGIVGFGHTGQATAKIAGSFGMEVYVYTSKAQHELPGNIRKSGLDELFATCDVVSLHCPLNESTHEMVDGSRLSLMKSDAILINTGRGGLIDEKALATALKEHKLLAAGLDVLQSEPPLPDNPLLKLPNCFITPHIAWATKEARMRLMKQVIANVKAYISGNPINNVLKND